MVVLSGGEQGKRGRGARDYLRVSLDRSGRARSLEEQHAEGLPTSGIVATGSSGWGQTTTRDQLVADLTTALDAQA